MQALNSELTTEFSTLFFTGLSTLRQVYHDPKVVARKASAMTDLLRAGHTPSEAIHILQAPAKPISICLSPPRPRKNGKKIELSTALSLIQDTDDKREIQLLTGKAFLFSRSQRHYLSIVYNNNQTVTCIYFKDSQQKEPTLKA